MFGLRRIAICELRSDDPVPARSHHRGDTAVNQMSASPRAIPQVKNGMQQISYIPSLVARVHICSAEPGMP